MTAPLTDAPCANCGDACDYKYCCAKCRLADKPRRTKRTQLTCKNIREREAIRLHEIQDAMLAWELRT